MFLKLHHPGLRKICVATWFDYHVCSFLETCLQLDDIILRVNPLRTTEVSNVVFTLIFTAEVLFKWVGLGLADYFADGMNILDFVIVVVGLVEILFLGSSSFTAFRALRFGRLVKLIRFMKSLQDILRVLVKSLEGIFYVSMLLLLFIVIYSILGMQFFQHKLSDGEGGVPRNNYDTFHWAFVSTWCSSAKRENFKLVSHFNTYYAVKSTRTLYLLQLSHSQYYHLNVHTKLALRARTQVHFKFLLVKLARSALRRNRGIDLAHWYRILCVWVSLDSLCF